MDNLAKIDLVRERMNVSYEEAKMALEAAEWNVVDALVKLEQDAKSQKEEFFVKGSELVEKVKELVRQGNINKIKVKQDDKVLIEIPVTAGVVGALLAPQLAIIGAVATLVSRSTIEIEKTSPDSDDSFH
ncbi:MAG TPA: DUF4342 domain-containing protein [Bacillota bacterium]|nr:DUF4342 domain-containing protein [Bacillota bacterium]HOL09190.1 DUF4342 domain-containing protein [Bacillota bacterium]HPO97014.1 DUF4342 domain-containing protein [Bacillota bacterium]